MREVIYHEDGTTTEVVHDFGETTIHAAPLVLTATAFMDYCYVELGGGTTGMARYAQIIRLARAAAQDQNNPLRDLIGAAVERYDSARSGGTFAKDQVAQFAAILVGTQIMQQAEADNLANNWPEG